MAFGVQHKTEVLRMEHDYLGWETTIAPKPATAPKPAPEAPKTPSSGKSTETKGAKPVVVPMPMLFAVESSVEGQDEQQDEQQDDSAPSLARKVAIVDELASELQHVLELPRVVKLKLVVDYRLVNSREDWFQNAQALVAEISDCYRALFGIELRLHALMPWDVPEGISDPDRLLEDLRASSRDGADILLGITNLPTKGGIEGRGDLPPPEMRENGAYALIYASGRRRPYQRSMLHELGHIFGALDIQDPHSEAYRKKSWMSYAHAEDDEIPWIDAENRRVILERKNLPFVREKARRR